MDWGYDLKSKEDSWRNNHVAYLNFFVYEKGEMKMKYDEQAGGGKSRNKRKVSGFSKAEKNVHIEN